MQNKLKQKNKLNVLMEQVKNNALLENDFLENTFLENDLLESPFFKNTIQNYRNKENFKLSFKEEDSLAKTAYEFESCNQKIKDTILHRFNNEGKKGNRKGERRLIFILLCKVAMFVDDDMLNKISSYLEISYDILTYYVDIFRAEFIKCNRGMLEAKARRDKYYLKKFTHLRLLALENNTEYGKAIINRGLKYSIQKYKKASLEVKQK